MCRKIAYSVATCYDNFIVIHKERRILAGEGAVYETFPINLLLFDWDSNLLSLCVLLSECKEMSVSVVNKKVKVFLTSVLLLSPYKVENLVENLSFFSFSNRIRTTSYEDWRGVSHSLNTLYLSNNLLTELPSGVFSQFRTLRYISVSNNYLEKVSLNSSPENFEYCRSYRKVSQQRLWIFLGATVFRKDCRF